MDFSQTIKSLYEERDLLNQAIAVLERVHAGAHLRRRGRPPKWLAQVRGAVNHEDVANHHAVTKRKRPAKKPAGK